MTEQSTTDLYIGRITKKYILDFMNTLLFANTVLWDGIDQFNELPVMYSSNEDGYRIEQRCALFINRQIPKALRLSVTVTESSVQKACYRFSGISAPLKIDDGKQLYYPLEGRVMDISMADLNLGSKDSSSYSFCDNTNQSGTISNSRLFTLLRHVLGSTFLTVEDSTVFKDMLNTLLSTPPLSSDPHFKPVFGVPDDNCRD